MTSEGTAFIRQMVDDEMDELEKEEAQSMDQKARQHVQTRFLITRHLRDYLDLFIVLKLQLGLLAGSGAGQEVCYLPQRLQAEGD
jgi:hypothetical protein